MSRVCACALTALCAALFVACGGPFAKKDAAKKEGVKKGEADWHAPGETVRHGDAEVKLVSVSIEEMQPEHFAMKRPDHRAGKPYLFADLTIKNVNPAKKLTFNTWADAGLVTKEFVAQLRDDLGNRYKPIDTLFYDPKGRASLNNVSLYPDKPHNDLVVFEPPVEKAKTLELVLPAGTYGGEGAIFFRIPISTVRKR